VAAARNCGARHIRCAVPARWNSVRGAGMRQVEAAIAVRPLETRHRLMAHLEGRRRGARGPRSRRAPADGATVLQRAWV
jgi:hypothetical protein